MTVSKDLQRAGFLEADDSITNLVIDICGDPAQGKTHFTMTAPGAIAYFDFDYGSKGVLGKFLKNKKIYRKVIDIPDLNEENLEKISAKSKVIWDDFIAAYNIAMANHEVKTIVIDTATEAYELCRLYKFGKLVEVPPHYWGHVKALFRRTLKLSSAPGATQAGGKNLIMIHKLKDEWVGKSTTGKRIEAGFDDAPYIADIAARAIKTKPTRHDPDTHFTLEITKCRMDTNLEGQTLKDQFCNFPFLASLAVDGTDEEDWK